MNVEEIHEIIQLLRESDSDNYRIEAKDASQGLPESLDETLSAFGNMPEGGIILLGVAENGGSFDVTGVWDAAEAQAALGGKARNRIVPALQLGAIDVATVEGKQVVTCVVPPQPAEFKPFRVKKFGPSFTRSADGDYQLSGREELYLASAGKHQFYDRAPVAGASVEKDLDQNLVEQYLAAQLQSAPRLSRASREEQLMRTNVVADDSGTPTVAAIYALGVHPQQFFPHLAIKAHVNPGPGSDPSVRLMNQRQFSGPVPDLLDQAFSWVQEHLNSAVVFNDGQGRDLPELPAVAIRELIANAIVHRDLSPASDGTYVEIIKAPTKLIIKSPGGLWGITERQLGFTGPHARNPVLYDMCSAIRTQHGNRIIEAHATGIPAVRQALSEAFLPEPYFKDGVINFQATLSSTSTFSAEQLAWLSRLPGAATLSAAQKHALVTMYNGEEVTNSSYREAFPMDSVKARNELQELVHFGLVEVTGSGRSTAYSLKESAKRNPFSVDLPQTSQPPTPEPATPEPQRQPVPGPSISHDTEPQGYLSTEQKAARVREALQEAGIPLSHEELLEATGLTRGQLAPTRKRMVDSGELLTTKTPLRARNQKYYLA